MNIEEHMKTHCWCCDGPLNVSGHCERSDATGPYCSCPSVDWRRRALVAEDFIKHLRKNMYVRDALDLD